MFKKNNLELDPLARETFEKKLKVYTDFNPYFEKNFHSEIDTIEQVSFYHKKVKQTRALGDFLKDRKHSPGFKKKVIKDLLKFWEKEFREHIDFEQSKMLQKTSKVNRKKIKKIRFIFAYIAIIVSAIGMIITRKEKFLETIPFIGKYFTSLYQMIDNPLYHNLLISLVYLTIILILYKMILKTYFETLRNMGANAESYISKEFKKIKTNFQGQQKKLRTHLLKSRRKGFKKTYKINNIFDPNVMINKLENYSKNIETRYTKFRKKYFWLLLFHFLMILGIVGITGYIGYQFVTLYL